MRYASHAHQVRHTMAPAIGNRIPGLPGIFARLAMARMATPADATAGPTPRERSFASACPPPGTRKLNRSASRRRLRDASFTSSTRGPVIVRSGE